MYGFIGLAGRIVEVCDECGFIGSQLEIRDIPARLSEIRRAWSSAMDHDEQLLRARPAPATWCVIEYSRHTAFVLAAIEWGAQEIVAGRSPDWSSFREDPLGDATEENHDCTSVTIAIALRTVEQALSSLGAFSEHLSDAELARSGDYAGGLVLDTASVIRHGVHDAEHHLLDIRRGVARLLLPS